MPGTGERPGHGLTKNRPRLDQAGPRLPAPACPIGAPAAQIPLSKGPVTENEPGDDRSPSDYPHQPGWAATPRLRIGRTLSHTDAWVVGSTIQCAERIVKARVRADEIFFAETAYFSQQGGDDDVRPEKDPNRCSVCSPEAKIREPGRSGRSPVGLLLTQGTCRWAFGRPRGGGREAGKSSGISRNRNPGGIRESEIEHAIGEAQKRRVLFRAALCSATRTPERGPSR
jgi:hypothetical protein